MKLKHLCLTACLLVTWLVLPRAAAAQGLPTIKIGILHSLSGTMAISDDLRTRF